MVKDATLQDLCKTEPANLRKAISRMEKIKRDINRAPEPVGLRGTLYTEKAKKEIDKAIKFYRKEIVRAKVQCARRKVFLKGRR